MGLMDLIGRLDNCISELCAPSIVLNSQPDPEFKKEVKEYEEGVFHIKDISTGDHRFAFNYRILEISGEGKIIEFGERNDVTCFILKSSKNTGTADYFEKLSQGKKDSLKNKKIKYFKHAEYYHSVEGGDKITATYRIDVLGGPLKGNFFEKTIFPKYSKSQPLGPSPYMTGVM